MPTVHRVVLLAAALVILAVGLPAGAAPASAAWVRVQFDRRITSADQSALVAAGLTATQYVPRDAYLAFADTATARAVADLDGVASVRELRPVDKTSSDLAGATGTVTVQVLAAGARADRVAAQMDLTGDVLGSGDLRGDGAIAMLTATVPAARLGSLAARADVLRIERAPAGFALEDEGSDQVMAGNVVNGQPVPGYRAFLEGLGIDGSGVVMSVVDDGVDPTHPDFAGRIAQRFSYGPVDRAVPSDGHGTHVAGILGGAGAAIGPLGTLRDADGLAYGLGVAPGVTLVDQPAIAVPVSTPNQALKPVAPFPPADGFRGMVGDAVSADAVGWNASWTDGGGAGAGYTANGASLDALTRDADGDTEGNRGFTFVFSAGNSGSGTGTRVTSPKEAKNLIVVASSRGHRAGNVDSVSSFSSRGPARDGRIVPTITAPGEVIMSARAATGVLCTAPLSGNPAEAPPADGLTLYTGCSGTSMASPHVAGSVALIHDWWRDRNAGADPSPAMDKALLVNSAHDLGTPDVPNRDEGWGRVDLAALFDPAAQRVLVDQSVVLGDVGDAATLQVRPVDPTQPLRVTVAWTDAPGMPSEEDPALVNDLDLTVTDAAGATYLGNVFADGVSVAGGESDQLNNLENVLLPAAGAGDYTVSVSAANLPGDGIPGLGDGTDQDFALVITNAQLVG